MINIFLRIWSTSEIIFPNSIFFKSSNMINFEKLFKNEKELKRTKVTSFHEFILEILSKLQNIII